MLLNQTDLYAIRAMSFLALQDREERFSAGVLSNYTNIPVHYLNKIMRRFVEADLVNAKKGHQGGFQLNKKPESIRIMDILDVVKPPGFTEFCVFGWEQCHDEHPCPLHHSWSGLRQGFKVWACQTTLKHIQQGSHFFEDEHID